MITEITGDLLTDDADILVNPVNCVGVMGKGLALQFKQRYPAAFSAYKDACNAGEMHLGEVHLFKVYKGPLIVHFPTKDHWRDPSHLGKIKLGLNDLIKNLDELERSGWEFNSIAIPALGAGLGGLPWGAVRKAIYDAFAAYDAFSSAEIDVRLYVPASGAGR